MKQENENVPLFKTWKGWYVFVVLFLVLLLLFFYGFTKYFS